MSIEYRDRGLRHLLTDQIKLASVSCGSVEIIIMHPDTWIELLAELIATNSKGWDRFSDKMIYKGIRVVRSEDVDWGKFLVY